MQTSDKSSRKKSIFRLEAVLPALTLVVVILVVVRLFFDFYFKQALEWGLTKANTAQVDIQSVHTSFLGASLEINDLQFTDPEKPSTNRFQIGQIKWKMLWDALLRGKAVIEIAGIEQIQIKTPRKSPGKVLPPTDSSDTDWKKVLTDKADEVSGGMISQITDLLQGFDPKAKLKEFTDNLNAATKIKEIQGKLQEQEKAISAAIAAVPTDQEIQKFQTQASSIAGGLSKNPAEAKNQIEQMKGLLDQAKGETAKIQAATQKVADQANSVTASMHQIDEAIAQDRKNLESKLKLPKLDPKAIGSQLFGKQVLSKATEIRHYSEMAKRYMPVKGGKGEKKPEEEYLHERRKGKNYEFGRLHTYPMFWLKKAEVSTQGAHSAAGGDVVGKILNVSSSQHTTGLPTTMDIKGEFPQEKIHGVEIKFGYDARADVPVFSTSVNVAQFPMQATRLSDTDDLKLGFSESTGRGSMKALVKGKYLEMQLSGAFQDLKPEVQAKSEKLGEILKHVLSEIKVLTLNAEAKGEIPNFAISVDSNLASLLANGLQKELLAKINEARAQIEGLINAKIHDQRALVEKQVNELKAKAMSVVNDKRKQAEQVQNFVQTKLSDAQKQAIQQAIPQNLPPAVNDLKKKFGF